MCLRLKRFEGQEFPKPFIRKTKKKDMREVFGLNNYPTRLIIPETNREDITMLNWVITFFVLAILAAVCGFGGLAGTFAEIAKFLAVIFVVLFVSSLIYSIITGRRPTLPSA